MSLTATIRPLAKGLRSEDSMVVLSHAWDVFGLAEEAAYRLTGQDGIDDILITVAAIASSSGASGLPLPVDGKPFDRPGTYGPADLPELAELLRQTHTALLHLADTPGQAPEDRDALRSVAEDSATAAEAFANLQV